MSQRNHNLPGLTVWPSDVCLVRQLAAELQTRDDIHKIVVVLPTKRLANWLTLQLVKDNGAMFLPRIMTLDLFLGLIAIETPLSNSADTQYTWQRISDANLELVVTSWIASGTYPGLRPEHAGEVLQLMRDIVMGAKTDTAFDAARTALHESARANMNDFVQIITSLEELARDVYQSLRPDYVRRAAIIHAFVEATEAGDLEIHESRGPWSRLYLAGFTSLPALDLALVRALLAFPTTHVWIPSDPIAEDRSVPGLGPVDKHATPIGEILSLTQHHNRPRQDETHGNKVEPKQIRIERLTSAAWEAARVAALIQHDIAVGVPPSQIAVLVPDEERYGPLLRRTLGGLGLKTNFGIKVPFFSTSFGRLAAALLAILDQPDDPVRTADFLMHPDTRHTLVSQGVAMAGTTGWSAYLADDRPTLALLIQHAGKVQDSHPLATWVKERFAPLLEDEVSLPLCDWVRQVSDLLFGLVDVAKMKKRKQSPENEQGYNALRQLVNDVSSPLHAAVLSNVATSFKVASRLLERLFSRIDTRTTGEQLQGIQILGIEEARFVPFDHVIIVGAVEGLFPRALPRDELVDDYLKQRMGLRGWDMVEAIEDTTFALLAARVPRLSLLYPAELDGIPQVRSRMIERLTTSETPEMPVVDPALVIGGDSPPLSSANHSSPLTLNALTSKSMGTSAFESLIRCPYKFALERLGVRTASSPFEVDLRPEGEALHSILQALFQGDLPADQDAVTAKLVQLTSELLPAELVDSPLHLELLDRSLPAFGRHISQVYDGLTDTSKALKEIDLAGLLTIKIGETVLTLAGRVDSVDETRLGWVVTDYKRQGTPESRDVRAGIVPQLVLYAMALAQDESRPLSKQILGYYSVLKGEWTGIAAGSDVYEDARSSGLIGRGVPKLEDLVATVLELLTLRVETIRSFSPDPSACGHCKFDRICRKDDPRFRDQLFNARAPWLTANAGDRAADDDGTNGEAACPT